jgi:protein involved in polysaccharide export with SLBB domain
MKKPSLVIACTSFLLVVFATIFVGCVGQGFLDPSEVVKAPPTNMTLQIYSQASPADENQDMPAGSTFPTADDLKFTAKDYVVGSLDVVDISVLDLFQEGLETVLRRQVTESGNIDLPLLPAPIKAEGLSQEQLREAIIQAYSPDVLKNPTVSVTVVLQRQNTFSILGAVARPGAYNMVKRDMRLLDAVAAAGGQAQTNIPWIYVFRQEAAQPVQPATQPSSEESPELPPLPEVPGVEKPKPRTPSSSPGADDLKKALPSATVSPSVGPRLAEMAWAPIPASKPAAKPSDVDNLDTHKSTKWVQSSGGKSTQVNQTADVANKPSGEGASRVSPSGLPGATSKPGEDIFGWKKLGGEGRIIAIDTAKLNAGDSRMNIIIQDNDVITIPLLEQGEFYIMGEIQRPGVYSLTGRKVTVKMAVAAAGNLGPFAWPKNSMLIRRLNDQQEQMIPINIEEIFLGKKPDIYLKANDVIAVGTNWSTPFLAVIRNAFRLTYGFGFIYDRNFAAGYPNPNKPDTITNRFGRW